ncbi:MAG: hypothetical protein IJ563_00245 [Selenomonadaceae bacterium]|nr:hypothetical protein [Selenomonadaceae bacterium]
MVIIDGKEKILKISKIERISEEKDIKAAIEFKNKTIDNIPSRTGTYISSDGTTTATKQSTSVARIIQTDTAMLYSALNASNQEIKFGSFEDEKDWIVETSNGNDSIISSAVSDVTINSGVGNDTIYVEGFGITSINAGVGDDYVNITGLGNNIIKYTNGDGNDIIQGYKTTDTIQIVSNSFSTQISGNDIIIKAGSGSINLKNAKGKNLNIQDNISNDDINYIKNTDPDTVISGTNGRDSVDNGVYVYGSSYNSLNANMTINTFDGDDTINNYADNVSINAGSGNDYINNLRSYLTVIAGSGNDTIYNYGHRGNIKGEDGNDSIVSYYFSYVTIDGGSGDDSIYSGGQDASILGGAGNDKITIAGKWSTVIAGEDNDTISNISYYSFINADSGNDSISSVGDNVTIQGGTGNDSITKSISSNNNVIQYASGDGNDILYGYNATDTIHITSGKYSTQTSGNDVILKVGSGSITVKDVKDKSLNIIGDLTNDKSDTLPTGLIYNKNKTSITASKKFIGKEINLSDYASTVVTLNSASAKNAQNLVGNDNNNIIKGSKGADTLNGGLGDDTLAGGKGKNTFIYDGRGSDVITDYKVGDTIKTYTDVTASAINKKNLTLTTADGGSLFIKNGKGKRITVNDLTLT